MQRSYKYLDIITVVFVVVLLLANLVASVKVTKILGLSFTAGLFFFPLSYLVGDILTEVYGYSKSRRVIWTGFISLLAANLIIKILVSLPPDPHWTLQPAYEQIFGLSMRVSLASMFAYFCGEFANSYTLAKMKIATEGKLQFARIIGSTVVGEFVDTVIFYPLAFWGSSAFTTDLIISIMVANYIVKVSWETIAYPFTKRLLIWLKKTENEDYYDYKTDFNPLHLN